ncbi:hypothetical protein FA15DRAFT_653740 [Coprinopsis marcescibilis]|uniref:Uncharacterized protein n=1 Tax=Coprinopsis marcescibilis TaxID=230819 RepID=A0A5C3L2Q6_COPMA|nr:hypothetical protein FA15DRAFT_653740 [Coprinopsis marcescibilis]
MPRIIHTDDAFKKSQQIVGRPGVTDHDISEDFIRFPPNNLESPIDRVETPKDLERDARQQRRDGLADTRRDGMRMVPAIHENEVVLGVHGPKGRTKERRDADLKKGAHQWYNEMDEFSVQEGVTPPRGRTLERYLSEMGQNDAIHEGFPGY